MELNNINVDNTIVMAMIDDRRYSRMTTCYVILRYFYSLDQRTPERAGVQRIRSLLRMACCSYLFTYLNL